MLLTQGLYLLDKKPQSCWAASHHSEHKFTLCHLDLWGKEAMRGFADRTPRDGLLGRSSTPWVRSGTRSRAERAAPSCVVTAHAALPARARRACIFVITLGHISHYSTGRNQKRASSWLSKKEKQRLT